MKREIKFRAWDSIVTTMIHPEELINLDGETSKNMPERYTLMQFTGLKDKNGKDIYEGDIVCQRVETDYGERDFEQTVDFNEGAFYPVCECPGYEFEIIGNIYENPELLNQ